MGLYYMRIMQLSDDRKKRIIALYFNQHNTYAEIAETERISPRDINAIIKEEEARRPISKNINSKERYLPKPTNYFLKVRHPWKWPSHYI